MISVRYHIKKKAKTSLVGSVQPAKLYTYDDHLSKSNIHSLVLFFFAYASILYPKNLG